MNIHEEFKLANLVTGLNILAGVTSIFLSSIGKFKFAILAIILALVCDFFDGRLARRANKASAFGTELDSLSDIISFGIAPIMLGFSQFITPFAIFSYVLNLYAAVFRLARYNVLHRLHYFIGMPITFNAIIVLITMISGVPETYWPFIYLGSAILMACPYKIRKV